MAAPDYYQTLGVSEYATTQKIKAAFRKLALQYHPDKNPGNEEAISRFTRIQKAYEVLSDPERRGRYDKSRAYRLTRLASSFSFRPVYDPGKIRLSVNKRVALLEELIPVTIRIFVPGKDFRLKGVHQFEIAEGPNVNTFSTGENNAPLLIINYLLKPKGIGYFEIGPASFISNGNKYLSDSVHVKVNCPPSQITYRPATRFEKIQSTLVLILIVTYTILIGYNLYKYDILPRIKDSPYPQAEYSEGASIADYLNDARLTTGLSPYDEYFGAGIKDPVSLNQIRFINGNFHEAIVCLTDTESGTTIRNNYIQAGHQYTMANIPDGNYYLKVFFGNDWNPEKRILNNRIKGAFNRNMRFESFHQEINILNMAQIRLGDTLNYKIYNITLYPVSGGTTKSIISDEKIFFN